MKFGTLILYLTVFTGSNLFAQNQSHTFYYPLNIGDFWEYEFRDFGMSSIETREVIGDTLMLNGKSYRIIETDRPLSASLYQRIKDSTNVYQFFNRFEPPDQIIPDEFLLFRLDIKVGDTWNFPFTSSPTDSGFFQVTQIADTTLWSFNFKFAKIESFLLPDSSKGFGPNFILVDSIGVLFEDFETAFLRLRGAIIGDKQFGTITSVRSFEDTSLNGPTGILQNYPNPFNSSTTVEYRLNRSAHVRISVFNVLGERVRLLTDGFQVAGSYRMNWSGENDSGVSVSSGIYILTIEIDNRVRAKKVVLFLK